MKRALKQQLAQARFQRSLLRRMAEAAEKQVERNHAAWVQADDEVIRLEAALQDARHKHLSKEAGK